MQSPPPLRNREPLMSLFALVPSISTTLFTCVPDRFRSPQATVLATEGDAIARGVKARMLDHEANREVYSDLSLSFGLNSLVTSCFLTSPTALFLAVADLLLLRSARVSTFAALGTKDAPPTATLA